MLAVARLLGPVEVCEDIADEEVEAMSNELEQEGRRLRAVIGGFGVRRRYQHFPQEIRRQVVGFAERSRAARYSWQWIADALGLRLKTVRRWTGAARGECRMERMVPVVVRAESRPVRAMAVVLPNGVRLEGVGVEEAVEVLQALV